MIKHIRNFLNGSVYGVILIIPGISATIFAIILGFYDELIFTVNHFREDYRKNVIYLSVFLLGVAAGAVAFSSVVLLLIENYSFPTMLFFIGLMVGIVPLIFSKVKGTAPKIAPREIVLSLLAFAALFALSRGVTAADIDPEDVIVSISPGLLLYLFFAGIINGATLVIPGLSGAFLLLIMGLYHLVIFAISSVGVFFGDMDNLALLHDICVILLPYGVGAFFGCLGMARLMEKLMRYYNKAVYAVILGLILGSAITLLFDPMVAQGVTSALSLVSGAVTFCAGYAAAYILGKKQKE